VVVYRHQPGPVPVDPELAVVNQRLEAMKTILSDEAARLNGLNRASMRPTDPDLTRLDVLRNDSCTTAAIHADRAAAGGPAVSVDLSSPLPQMSARDIMNATNGNAPVTLPGGPADLHQGLSVALNKPGSRAIVVIERADGTPGHAFNAENLGGHIWLFEAHDGVAVPLAGQPAGVVGVEGFYPLNVIKQQGGYCVIVTHP
jgi:hypothetical protein